MAALNDEGAQMDPKVVIVAFDGSHAKHLDLQFESGRTGQIMIANKTKSLVNILVAPELGPIVEELLKKFYEHGSRKCRVAFL